MEQQFTGVVLGLGFVGSVWLAAEMVNFELPVIVGLLLTAIIVWVFIWRLFLQPAIDPMLSGY